MDISEICRYVFPKETMEEMEKIREKRKKEDSRFKKDKEERD